MTESQIRRQALLDALSSRIAIIDGAMGSILQAKLKIEDYGGPAYENCVDHVNLVRPDLIAGVHRAYLEAGADIVETNSFNGHPVSLAEFHLADKVSEVNRAAAAIAREQADAHSRPGRPRWVAGSMGPTTKVISVNGGVTFDQLRDGYYRQAKGLIEGGADILLLETCNDARTVKAGILGIEQLFGELGDRYPVIVSGTVETMGTLLAGQGVDAFTASLSHANLLALGLNCGTGPEFMTDHLRTIHAMSPARVSCYPNAGLPLPDGSFPEGPDSLAAQLERFADAGWLNLVGGCCGTTPAHIAAIARMAEGKKPRATPAALRRAFYSGIELVEAEDSVRPLIVGERTNVIGSRAFKKLINEEKWEEATDIARRQVRNGAHVVDVCLQQSERDERRDIPPFYEKLIAKIKAPVMIDTTDPAAVELSLTYCQGKSIINSINLEDGEEKFEKMCPIAKAYGAALVVGTIDEDKLQAQAFTRERKLAIAQRSHDLLTGKYGIPPEDIIFDPLVFPCATGDENYIGGAAETVEGVRLIKERIPYVKTVLGVSNISFGLPAAAREIVNSVFLYHCTKAGLDLAIVNAEKLERYASIPAGERELAENLLFNYPPPSMPEAPRDWREQTREQKVAVNQFHIAAIAEHYRGAAAKEKPKKADLPLDQRLANYIIEGSKDGLVPDLDLKLAEGVAPLDIINGPLMDGMTEVGRLFNNNELIVAEVLQSAEAMKAAVNHLQQFMEKSQTAARGRVVLATVKGDVHDIGKNLVEIILANNGYEVINLGIKVPPEDLIKAWREHQPDAIGVSGLLVKSAQQMVLTAQDFRTAGVRVPLLVGGAALSEKFTNGKIGPAYHSPTFYAKDAMTGLGIMNTIMDPGKREQALASHVFTEEIDFGARHEVPVADPGTARSGKVRVDVPVPPLPYPDRRVRLIGNVAEVWSYINPYMLYGRHLGFKGPFEAKLAERDPTALALYHDLEEVKQEAGRFLKIRAVWRYFEAERDGNGIHLFEAGASSPAHSFHFGRQPRENGLCLSDYVLPSNGQRDSVAVFVVTSGEGIRERAEEAKSAGQFFKAHALQALAIESAEGCAEYLHRRIREEWGFPDPEEMTMQQRFTSRYRGKRYSPGYPACPNLDDQQGIWKLLQPEEIGVKLTEGMMMDPEASVSAIV
ncbi:MAG: methionine synthase, partial [Acidobacteria bacterium]|nr:methionine synthase [Acidobacteriota bacterium]